MEIIPYGIFKYHITNNGKFFAGNQLQFKIKTKLICCSRCNKLFKKGLLKYTVYCD